MDDVVTLEKWLRRGRQRSALVQALRKPMIPSELCRQAQLRDPHIQLRDLWLILPEMINRGLMTCLTRGRMNGRVYALTPTGRHICQAAFRVSIEPHPADVNWTKYGWVARASVRRITLDGLSRLTERGGTPQSASSLRRFLRNQHPIGLNPVLRCLKELLGEGLVKWVGATPNDRRLYQLSGAGRRIAGQLSR